MGGFGPIVPGPPVPGQPISDCPACAGIVVLPAMGSVFPLPFEFLGALPPASGEEMARITFPLAVVFPPNFALTGQMPPSVGSLGFPPTSPPFIISIYRNITIPAGTMSIDGLGVYTFTTTGGIALGFNATDIMTCIAPVTTDATAANFGFTFMGQYA